MEIYEEIVRLKKEGIPAALAILVRCEGSSPQKEGAKMLIKADGTKVGTIGGGEMEAEVVQSAIGTIRSGGGHKTISLELTDERGHACGGKVLVYIELLLPEPHLFIVGCGHVGMALSHVARFAGFRITLIDDRPELLTPESLPDEDRIVIHDFKDVFSKVRVEPGNFIVIATRSHHYDFEVAKAALKTEAFYIGVLGSNRKKAALIQFLQEQGVSREDVERILTPVGLPIGAITAEEIAISIMAQIIRYRRDYQAASSDYFAPCQGADEETL